MADFAYEVFTEVVQQKTFVAAAARLNVTPSAVSHSIAQLETTLGFPLFIRHRTGVELTPDGSAILPVIQEILNKEAQLQQVADSIQGLNSGLVRLGAFSSVCINWLPTIIQTFKKRYPQVDVEVVQGTFPEIARQVRVGSIDIGFSTLPVEENVQVEPVAADTIRCVTPADFTPHNKEFVTGADIADQHFILQQADYDGDTKKALDRYNVAPNSLAYSIDDQSILSMVESGLGFGILPDLALQKLVGNVHIYPFSEAFRRTICVLTRKEAPAPSTQHFLNDIHRYLQKTYGDDYLGQSAPSH
ncbi:LysR family transcriptional regulator [Schleiferilactobacillus perolens]|jgi:DNA-binding transcriptional LysR family regulator|uniref:Transcriptional regulator n=1 Tax=Schleiferilactobacillus perolens DSM 12744 TaxID=1423792 RepID=A0A0R1MXD2_9LACO|nr:LysR family transcriptional regulator [Schleiferilactobacillus perolens]KRL12806.1 transcriptional regulator [Schleiferilactobacillus perolens DSM 12744]MCI1891559.1 LysR family transcriptional regulator [Schleiferilactobacillus harbinensis]MCI1913666.1 LysR family transcriptional regulator [Schleiferilactobacillus harbinensis]MCI2172039.1 LysR family transcriptional regulator [Schleiferilactobacillus perolens]